MHVKSFNNHKYKSYQLLRKDNAAALRLKQILAYAGK
jgi:hypothetical protein